MLSRRPVLFTNLAALFCGFTMYAIFTVLPLTFAFDALDAVAVQGADLGGVIDEIAVLVCMSAAAVALAALTLRRRTA